MKEKTITNKILKYLKNQPCCFAFKEFGGLYGTAGIPDVLYLVRRQIYAKT